MAQRLLVIDSTGSRGGSALETVARNSDIFVVFALSAHCNMQKLFEQCLRFEPTLAIVSEPHHAIELQAHLQTTRLRTEVQCGVAALCAAAGAPECDMVMGTEGAAGLSAVMSAARAARKILLLNKDALMMSTRIAPEAVSAR
ncbi:hypothetical protein BK659_18860 [Pseudomonas brassicacearum]|uniref:1-deoxy-D-xylulose 5-phosphate reductoisomerase N-terminal domain-containing protein n=1 Tax=Pseudomonas brassicacearum TaxID=930166 RepID=A0A423H3L7_9PSED|nr:hypothetical protein [Pseudomonas brassicacearum]RON07343.1 hypothetical protein BK659_18860 [Pseudomonas brassicacearum]